MKANQGAAGVDGESIAEFEADLSNNPIRLPIGSQRDVPDQEWPTSIARSRKAHYARNDAAGQQCEIENPLACRACVRRAKGSDGAVHQDYRDRPSDDQDRNGQPRLQHQTLNLPAQDRRRITGLRYGRRPMRLIPNSDQAKSIAGVRESPSR